MSTWSRALFAHAERLRDERAPFVLATVVRARRPTSATPGDRALVLADGTVEGFVGGVCAESTVRLEGLRVLASGRATMLRITPDAAAESAEGEQEPDTVTVANPCLSGGAVELFLEPQLPPPLVEVFGDSPTARALREVGAVLDYDVRTCAPDPDFGDGTETAVVVASHGRDEEPVLRAALRSGVAYVGLIASPRRGRAVLDALGEPDAERVHTPAGLDLGARSPHEIALSVYAEIVATRPGVPEQRREHTVPEVVEAVDPVCGMTVAVAPSTPQSSYEGRRYYFCGIGCAEAFAAWPARYATSGAHAG
ncbi:cytochrome oxidase I [Saccharomonospora piscinae]|uniref:Cytochrome oxidase I n=1 Tax=Saccharomonospora piscinae TaxID=687388 RepID=A0A1V9A213_SACPI|nr:XdhC family protein [Saccharomonospora piscinae]OQO91169.1 cytochrome oxidase I [Saccharomonospora piscinae]